MQLKHPAILFDGFCNLCNGTVDFLIKKDHNKQFTYISLQSESGKLLIREFQIPINVDTVILIKLNRVYFESDAVIEIAGRLSYPWKLVVCAKYIPKKIRDGIYRLIAKNRYRWFGKRETCRVSTFDKKDFSLFKKTAKILENNNNSISE
jgi:predicted DCC family thiol-disulfide oxidoreductase YuxK